MKSYESHDSTWKTADDAKLLVTDHLHSRIIVEARQDPIVTTIEKEQIVDAQCSVLKPFQRTQSAGRSCSEVEQCAQYSAVRTASQQGDSYSSDHHFGTGRYNVGR